MFGVHGGLVGMEFVDVLETRQKLNRECRALLRRCRNEVDSRNTF